MRLCSSNTVRLRPKTARTMNNFLPVNTICLLTPFMIQRLTPMKQFAQNKFLVLLVAALLIANLALMLYFFVFRNNQEEKNKPPRVSDYVQKELGFTPDQA